MSTMGTYSSVAFFFALAFLTLKFRTVLNLSADFCVHAGGLEQIKYLCKVWEFMCKLPTDINMD